MRISPGLVLFFPLMLVLADSHAQIFMCKDAAGHTLTSDRPIPECADRAMRELDNRGMVRHEIAAPMTAEQKRQQQADEEKRKAEQAAAQEQKRNDRAIRLRYRSERDIDVARKRSLGPVQDQLKSNQASLAAANEQRSKVQAEIESRKKKKAGVPPALQRKLEDFDQAVTSSQNAIQDGEAEIERINARYDETLQRYRELMATTSK